MSNKQLARLAENVLRYVRSVEITNFRTSRIRKRVMKMGILVMARCMSIASWGDFEVCSISAHLKVPDISDRLLSK